MTVTDREHAEAIRVLYSTCKHARRPMPATRYSVAAVLLQCGLHLSVRKPARAEACVLTAAEFVA